MTTTNRVQQHQDKENELHAITALDVIQHRQGELVNIVSEIDQKEKELLQQLESLRHERKLRMFEYDMLDRFDERNMVRITSTTTVETFGRHKPSDKLGFEDSLKMIINNAGRPVRLCELITELEKYGYRWSKYVTAQAYISNSGIVERAYHGYYQLVRSR